MKLVDSRGGSGHCPLSLLAGATCWKTAMQPCMAGSLQCIKKVVARHLVLVWLMAEVSLHLWFFPFPDVDREGNEPWAVYGQLVKSQSAAFPPIHAGALFSEYFFLLWIVKSPSWRILLCAAWLENHSTELELNQCWTRAGGWKGWPLDDRLTKEWQFLCSRASSVEDTLKNSAALTCWWQQVLECDTPVDLAPASNSSLPYLLSTWYNKKVFFQSRWSYGFKNPRFSASCVWPLTCLQTCCFHVPTLNKEADEEKACGVLVRLPGSGTYLTTMWPPSVGH